MPCSSCGKRKQKVSTEQAKKIASGQVSSDDPKKKPDKQ